MTITEVNTEQQVITATENNIQDMLGEIISVMQHVQGTISALSQAASNIEGASQPRG